MKAPASEPLIYAPAKRRGIGLIFMLSGPPGSGKTKSALRLATGLAGDGPIDACDTEHGRMLYYADDFKFNHLELKEPFRPSRFEAAAVLAQQRKAAVWICDSFSHEHVGPGGMLDMFEANLQRMAGDDFNRRDQLKYTAWIEPKGEHKHLLQRLWQLNTHIILCCHAEKKLDLIKNEKGKNVPNPDRVPSPVCAPDIPYAMTASFLFDAARPGVPIWLKRFDKIEPLIDVNKPLDEETGRRLAAWARGDQQPAAAPPRSRPAAPPVDEKTEAPGSVENHENQQPAGAAPADQPPADGPAADSAPPPSDGLFPGDIPLDQPAPKRSSKNEAVLGELIDRFEKTVERADHLAIVDQKAERDRIEWFKKKQPEMYRRLRTAMERSWERTDPRKKEVAA